MSREVPSQQTQTHNLCVGPTKMDTHERGWSTATPWWGLTSLIPALDRCHFQSPLSRAVCVRGQGQGGLLREGKANFSPAAAALPASPENPNSSRGNKEKQEARD